MTVGALAAPLIIIQAGGGMLACGYISIETCDKYSPFPAPNHASSLLFTLSLLPTRHEKHTAVSQFVG